MEVDGNGKSVYYPQYKGWFGWKYIRKNYDDIFATFYCKCMCIGLSHLKSAQDYIDQYVKQRNSEKISSIKYIEYP